MVPAGVGDVALGGYVMASDFGVITCRPVHTYPCPMDIGRRSTTQARIWSDTRHLSDSDVVVE